MGAKYGIFFNITIQTWVAFVSVACVYFLRCCGSCRGWQITQFLNNLDISILIYMVFFHSLNGNLLTLNQPTYYILMRVIPCLLSSQVKSSQKIERSEIKIYMFEWRKTDRERERARNKHTNQHTYTTKIESVSLRRQSNWNNTDIGKWQLKFK